jgi:hypothetical protein
MTASIQAKSNGTQGALQVNSVDAVVFDSTGIVSGDTNTVNKTLGYGQTWQSFTVGTQRVNGTTYYNTTGKPIVLFAAATNSGNSVTITVVINGVTVTSQSSNANAVGVTLGGTFVVPPGASYSANNVNQWSELR